MANLPAEATILCHFEALMNKSPISQVDVTTFLREMRRTPSGTLVTTKLLAGKLQSSSEAQAIQAFDVLEQCLSSETEGSIEFRTEIGRYRFLNEIIRILSPKYSGNKTLPAVKERGIKFLDVAAGTKRKQWFPSEHSKILAVYQSLVDGGVIKKNPKFPSTEADEEAELQKNIFDRKENAAVLQKLLQSKDPSDLQAANRLIKNLVEEETKRNERRAELHSLIDRIETSTSLLMEMLSQRKIDKEIVDELAENCKSLRQKLGGIATETNNETTSLLQASENLEQVLNVYEEKKNCASNPDPEDEEEVVVDDTERKIELPMSAMSLVDELLLKLDLGPTMDENKSSDATGYVDNLLNFDIDLSPQTSEKSAPDPLDEIEKMSRKLMEQSLLGPCGSNSTSTLINSELKNKLSLEKPTLSQMQKSSLEKSANLEISPTNNGDVHDPLALLDFGMFDKSHDKENNSEKPVPDKNLLFDFGESQSKPKVVASPTPPPNLNTPPKPPKGDEDILAVRQLLTSIKDLDLDKVELKDCIKPIDLNLDSSCVNVTLTLTFASVPEHPPCVKVAVVAFTNRNPSSGIYNYVFQLIPPKGLQVKLLPPTAMELSPWKKSFLPPPVLTQVALIVIPRNLSSASTKIKFILSYSTDDDDTALHNGDFEIPSSLLKNI